MPRITEKLVASLKPRAKDQFVRDDVLTGFGLKVSPKGRISFIAEGRVRGGRTRRVTLGQYPSLSVVEAREDARDVIRTMRKGEDPKLARELENARRKALGATVGQAFEDYIQAKDLKPQTARNYRNVFDLVFGGWKSKPLRAITRKDAEGLFLETRDARGLPMAAYAFRIISAVFNFAMADEVQGERLITENPADIIKHKKYKRTPKPRDRFLADWEIAKLIRFYQTEKDWPETPEHGVTDQGINFVMLLLCSGLRRSEGLRLRWEDIDHSERHFVVHDTKNSTDFYVPLSGMLEEVLRRQKRYLQETKKADSQWVFPAKYGDGHMTEPKSQLKKICDYTGVNFGFHDLRRTFATHAEANGVAYELIQKALNHKTKSVTQNYLITQIEKLREVFDAVADGYLRYYDPDREQQEQADKKLEEMSRKDRKKLAKKAEPAKFPDRGETEIVTSGDR